MTVIASWEELRARSGEIVAAMEGDERLKLAAAANPLLALLELGYQISDEARPAILDRLRLPPETAKRRAELREEIARHSGQAIDPDNLDDLRKLLFKKLKLQPYPDPRGCQPPPPQVEPPRKQLRIDPKQGPPTDPLETLRGRHPAIELLLEYRELGTKAWPFAPPEAYRAIRAGKTDTLLQNPRIRFKRADKRRQKRKDNSDG